MRTFYSWLLLAFFFVFSTPVVQAQKVGLVLSGGGAKGLAHVGVLKVLEKNRIPIDYIVGTSMGAIVGAMYASGYSPEEIEKIVLSQEFQDWVANRPLTGKVYNYFETDANPAALHLGLAIDSKFKTRITPRLINDATLNYQLATMLAPAGAIADYDFDRLMVPYRAVASEVFTRKRVVQRNGSLADAVRNSMAFPLAFRPIRQTDGRYLFDGAVVDNFPTGVMKEEFRPDIMIGVNVGDVAYKQYPREKDDQLLTGTLVFLGSNAADTLSVGPNGIFIQPELEGYGAGDFNRAKKLVHLGETAAQEKLALMLRRIPRREDTLALQQRRRVFQERAPRPDFKQVNVQGLPNEQQAFVRRFFRRSGTNYTPSDIEEGYFTLVDNDFFSNVYPRVMYDKKLEGYTLSVDARQANNLTADLGVLLSTRSMSNFYLGGSFRYLNRYLYTVQANATIGRFYNGFHAAFRVSLPGRIPIYVQPQITFNNFNYQDTGGLLGTNTETTQIQQRDLKTNVQIGFSPNYRSRYIITGGAFTNRDRFANKDEVSSNTTLDQSSLSGFTASLRFERNSQNRRQYATVGRRVEFGFRGITGVENYDPGSTAEGLSGRARNHQWLRGSMFIEQFFSLNKADTVGVRTHAWGFTTDVVGTTQGQFATYRSTLTASPAFLPLPDSRTLFLDRYRGTAYAAAGLHYVKALLGPIEWRSSVYVHTLVRPWARNTDNPLLARRLQTISRPYLTAMSGVTIETPVGPGALQFIYYDEKDHRFGVFAHIGYVLFRDRSLD